MAESQLVNNSSGPSSDESKKDFKRKLPYDPAVLKRQKLWSKDQLDASDRSGRVFSRVGAPGSANGRDSLVGTMTSHQGDRTANPPDSKHKEGDTQKYNNPSDSRSHGARGNNGAGFHDNARATLGAKAQYPAQPLHSNGRGLDDATHGRNFGGYTDSSSNYGNRSHGERDGNVTGRDKPRDSSAGNGHSVQYISQDVRRVRAGLANTPDRSPYNDTTRSHGGQANPAPPRNDADPGLKYSSDSRHHTAFANTANKL